MVTTVPEPERPMKQPVPAEHGMSRRAFVSNSGMALAGAAVLGPEALRTRPATPATAHNASTRALSVGFVEGVTDLRAAAGKVAVPAARLRRGDVGPAGAVIRVHLHGITPDGVTPASGIERLALDALLQPSDTQRDPLLFHAWSMTGGATPHGSSPATFVAPVAQEPSLGLALDVTRAGASERAVALFTAGRGSRVAKLREGLYLLAVQPRVWDRPRTVPAATDPAWTRLASIVVSVQRETPDLA